MQTLWNETEDDHDRLDIWTIFYFSEISRCPKVKFKVAHHYIKHEHINLSLRHPFMFQDDFK